MPPGETFVDFVVSAFLVVGVVVLFVLFVDSVVCTGGSCGRVAFVDANGVASFAVVLVAFLLQVCSRGLFIPMSGGISTGIRRACDQIKSESTHLPARLSQQVLLQT